MSLSTKSHYFWPMITNSTGKAKYFAGLDTLRSIGAFSVVLGHLELTKNYFGFKNLLEIPFYKNTSGHLGVVLFYVLSGFLITYLLLVEKEQKGKISIKRFYVRRALRIWPVYFLVVFFLFFVFPSLIELDYFAKPDFSNIWTWASFVLYLFVIPNFTVFGFSQLGGGQQLGTVGIEEQFYFFWPWVVRGFKNLLYPLLVIMIAIPFAPHFFDFVAHNYLDVGSSLHGFTKNCGVFFTYFKVNLMANGALVALFYFRGRQKILRVFFHWSVQLGSFIFGFGGWLLGLKIPFVHDEAYGLAFSIIILNAAVNQKRIINLDFRVANYLGKISYGVYVYHWFVIYAVLEIILRLGIPDGLLFNTSLYTLSILGTIALSHVSFYRFENWFLALKKKYTVVS